MPLSVSRDVIHNAMAQVDNVTPQVAMFGGGAGVTGVYRRVLPRQFTLAFHPCIHSTSTLQEPGNVPRQISSTQAIGSTQFYPGILLNAGNLLSPGDLPWQFGTSQVSS